MAVFNCHGARCIALTKIRASDSRLRELLVVEPLIGGRFAKKQPVLLSVSGHLVGFGVSPSGANVLGQSSTLSERCHSRFLSNQTCQRAVTAVVRVAKSFLSVPHCLGDAQ